MSPVGAAERLTVPAGGAVVVGVRGRVVVGVGVGVTAISSSVVVTVTV